MMLRSVSPWVLIMCLLGSPACVSELRAQDRKAEYALSVARGEGALPWVSMEPSKEEAEFRTAVEQRKTEMLAASVPLQHPVIINAEQLAQLRRNIDTTQWAKDWYAGLQSIADYIVAQPEGYVESMIDPLTPGTGYGFTCPNCVGRLSQESEGEGLIRWDYKNPDQFSCYKCNHVYPSAEYPETYTLKLPRMKQEFSFYLNAAQREKPDDLTGDLAYKFVNHPQIMSFTGYTRYAKAFFMIQALKPLGYSYQMTRDPKYAALAVRILDRLAVCYKGWVYHDIWMSFADCDPLYATWNDTNLKLEWKRNPFTQNYEKDSLTQASMTDTYFCAGRYMPSTDNIALLADISVAYDLIYDAADASGQPLWTDEARARVERDLLLEWVIGGEPFVGGRGKAEETNNKAPRVYVAQAAVARVLGVAELADVALRGYEVVRDKSLTYDGFSDETPAYTNMYLYDLVPIPEFLNGFAWPEGFPGRSGKIDPYSSDWKLRQVYRTYIDQLAPNGYFLPLGDSEPTARPSQHVVELGLKRYPEYYKGMHPALLHGDRPGSYAAHLLDDEAVRLDTGLKLPEIFFPAWMTAILRNGQSQDASLLALTFPPRGGHRHSDRLSIFYRDRGMNILGDLGYIGDSPMISWFGATQSHNLVVVDDRGQTGGRRSPSLGTQLHHMAVTPKVSMVEGSAQVYSQCSTYRRLNALVKGPEEATFVIDIFRVKGGDRHTFRLFSELASSEAGSSGSLTIDNVPMPEEPPLPNFGMSTQREHIFGLLDARSSSGKLPTAWKATWSEPARSYRLWMLTGVDQITLSNGPGQEVLRQAGRRVRYLDAVREGGDLSSTFVALHEPSGLDGAWTIDAAERIELPVSAGPEAVAFKLKTAWGDYLVLNEFAQETTVEGVRFQGDFGILHQGGEGTWLMSSGATTFRSGELGHEQKTPRWTGTASGATQNVISTASDRPADWTDTPGECINYALIDDGEFKTGFPVKSTEPQSIEIDRFPLQNVVSFDVPRLEYISQSR
jgi:hypothetical protein